MDEHFPIDKYTGVYAFSTQANEKQGRERSVQVRNENYEVIFTGRVNWIISIVYRKTLQNRLIYEPAIITGRNEVLAKVMFLHVSVILLTGGGACSNFSGVSAPIFWGGVCSKFWGGACSKFSGGGGIFSGGCLLQIFGGGYFFGGCLLHIFGIRSPFGRYASYWNAFLFPILFHRRNNYVDLNAMDDNRLIDLHFHVYADQFIDSKSSWPLSVKFIVKYLSR